ncbi:MAG: shikimate dehydrogenase [Azospirillum brasilense]|uniref:Shikimate dehydrogenase n=1 Tax=Roseomonas gilardii TaxID=257708 RepID=A0A1L7AJX3_9PROT|nr:shikimate dehydrogenase [Roseomonas gilardii]APT59074.1 shikimate dehydrogenase [Roseomonas gilardii]PZR13784.1 MAG: shikimate dehydrogenase [Azospirillum brasilense]
MSESLNGATRLYPIVGDPIAQVKSPSGVTRTLAERGHNAICVPAHVAPGDLADFFGTMARVRNVDGVIVTVPHKFASFAFCASTTPRAKVLRAVNSIRRNPDGSWHGDMSDGQAFVQAQIGAGATPQGARALLVGAGGAGSAIGLALLEAGVRELVVHDSDAARVDRLVGVLREQGKGEVRAGTADPTGFDMVCNATPSGMREGDPLPVAADLLRPAMSVGDVITAPEVTPLLQAARAIGCRTATGVDMFRVVQGLIVDFLLDR